MINKFKSEIIESRLLVGFLEKITAFNFLQLKLWIIIFLTGISCLSYAGDKTVLVFIIDGLQLDAAKVAAANGAKNLKFLMENGVYVREAYCTSPAPRMIMPDGSLPWGTSSSPNVAMHTGTHVFESRQMDDIFLSARRGHIKSVFAGGADNYKEFTTPDFCHAGSLTDSAVVQYGIDHFKKDGTRLLRLHLQQIRDSWSGNEDKLNPRSGYQQAIIKVDALLGKLIREFKNADVWENTYIIVAGDHGMGTTRQSEHPPSVLSSWSPFMNFYGPGIKKGKSIPYAETPDLALMINYFLGLQPLQGHTDPKVTIKPNGITGTFLSNIFEGTPDDIQHPKLIRRYLESKNWKPSDDYGEYRLAMLSYMKDLSSKNDQNHDGWQIPSCAWQKNIGDRPVFKDETGKDAGGSLPETRTKKGIPLGGIGAGNFMYNLCGSFGPFYMKPGCYEERFLSQGAFHIREQVSGKGAETYTLATEDVLPAWHKMNRSDGKYYALFPRGWCTYTMLQSNVTLQFFSPVIKDNYVETSLPVGVFLFKIKNPGNTPVKVSVMFTFPNAPYTVFDDSSGKKKLYTYKEKIRQGLFNKEIMEGNTTAILMGAKDKANPAETEGTEWCIATTGNASWVSAWDGNGDGSDIWNDFVDNGNLNGKRLSEKSKMPSGALAVQVDLDSGEVAEIPFVLSWYFPLTEFGTGTRWWKKFTGQYPQKPEQSFAMARDALKSYSKWLKEIEDWTDLVVKNPVYPEWLKQCTLNELYYTTFGGSFWENGCINKVKKFGNRPGQHLESVMECAGYRFFETFDVRHHVSITYRLLWPEIERDILLAYSDFIMDSKDGSCPHDAGSPDADPYFEYDNYGKYYNQDPLFGIKGRQTTPWSEFSPKFIQQVYALFRTTGNSEFLKETWPAVVRTYRYQLTTDTDDDGITEMKSSEYRNNRLFNAVLWAGALECLTNMCDIMNEPVLKGEVIIQLSKTRNAIEKNFWKNDPGYYKYNEKLDYLMADAMLGQRYLDFEELPVLLDENRLASHYKQAFKSLVLHLPDQDGDGIGDLGVANALTSDSKPGVEASEYSHEYEVWTGISYSFSANLYHWGKTHDDGAMMADALLGAFGVYRNSWLNEKTAFWFSTPEAWSIEDPSKYRALMYQRARAVWEVLNEVDPFR
jgi:uncharacterized protein (DUF608 family)